MKTSCAIRRHVLVDYLTGLVSPSLRRRLTDHLRACHRCQNLCQKVRHDLERDHHRRSQPNSRGERLFVDWMLLKDDAASNSVQNKPDDRLLVLRFQGMSQFVVLEDLIMPLAQSKLNIEKLKYDLFGLHREFFDLSLVAEGSPASVSYVRHYFEGHPLSYQRRNSFQCPSDSARSVRAYALDLLLTFVVDEPGLVMELCRIIGQGSSVPHDNNAVQQPPSSVLQMQAALENEGGFSQSGTPGFVIKARVAAPSEAARARLRQALETMRLNSPMGLCHIEDKGNILDGEAFSPTV